ncbi:hypothetical protein BS50DRAFT_582453 [Corynespora cassiicola Philippines]|uniref:Uncharacterized protein n=1 Tax=Corynespora cassiicola Philippines TaxID=1448308 RepID=A0A2T2P575_CORCC|nr:hypothetical protein BS50DRAFT_582453 [Corynespora cassiicola Philippines]
MPSQDGHDDGSRRRQQESGNGSYWQDQAADSSRSYSDRRHPYTSPDWQAVPRPWGTINPNTYRAIQDPALHSSSGSHHAQGHSHSMMTQAYEAPYAHAHPPALYSHLHPSSGPSSSSHQHGHQYNYPSPAAPSSSYTAAAPPNTRRITLSSLHALDQHRRPTSTMSAWARESQRDGPYNAVGYVESERRRQQRRQRQRPYHGDEYDYDESASDYE